MKQAVIDKFLKGVSDALLNAVSEGDTPGKDILDYPVSDPEAKWEWPPIFAADVCDMPMSVFTLPQLITLTEADAMVQLCQAAAAEVKRVPANIGRLALKLRQDLRAVTDLPAPSVELIFSEPAANQPPNRQLTVTVCEVVALLGTIKTLTLEGKNFHCEGFGVVDGLVLGLDLEVTSDKLLHSILYSYRGAKRVYSKDAIDSTRAWVLESGECDFYDGFIDALSMLRLTASPEAYTNFCTRLIDVSKNDLQTYSKPFKTKVTAKLPTLSELVDLFLKIDTLWQAETVDSSRYFLLAKNLMPHVITESAFERTFGPSPTTDCMFPKDRADRMRTRYIQIKEKTLKKARLKC